MCVYPCIPKVDKRSLWVQDYSLFILLYTYIFSVENSENTNNTLAKGENYLKK